MFYLENKNSIVFVFSFSISISVFPFNSQRVSLSLSVLLIILFVFTQLILFPHTQRFHCFSVLIVNQFCKSCVDFSFSIPLFTVSESIVLFSVLESSLVFDLKCVVFTLFVNLFSISFPSNSQCKF